MAPNDKTGEHISPHAFAQRLLTILKQSRGVEQEAVIKACDTTSSTTFAELLASVSTALSSASFQHESEAVHRALEHSNDTRAHGGLGLRSSLASTALLQGADADKVLFQVEAWLESLNAAEKARKLPTALRERPRGRRGMTLSEKIFAHHAIGLVEERGLAPGDVIRVAVDWIIASEISWVGMKKTLDQFGDYKVWRNDRFWLAGDHVVDPRNYETDLSKKLIAASDKAANDFKLTDYKGPNYTIIHTEFVRSRAEPGMLAIGSDSHTCSSGAVGCLAIGLGAADVAMPLVTGETWFKVPEAINVRFIGEPGPGIGGKDTILYILGELKRNTVAAERIVEFSGPGLKFLSTDARFAISNMCTEFGAITGVFLPDSTTQAYISARKQKNRKSSSLYFQPDADASYAGTFDIDLSKVQSSIALYPNPDDVVPVSEKAGLALDGCFIGACTTAEEDLILAAMVLQVGLAQGLKVSRGGKRHVVPGSLPVGARLQELGLDKAFEDAGFVFGVPGCSFCVGMGSDQAKEGETWLSSQNRNFANRMGKGSFGNLASAATVAASSFTMQVTDPSTLLAQVDMELFDTYRKHSHRTRSDHSSTFTQPTYVEPAFETSTSSSAPKIEQQASATAQEQLDKPIIESKVVKLGDYIDTDALAPAEFLVTTNSDAELGSHCLQYTDPDFREKVAGGQTVVVAGKAFGVGSSREEAVRALQGAGVEAVIAPSFAFIYGRNQPNLGLLGFSVANERFYELAVEGVPISIDVTNRKVTVAGEAFDVPLTDIELALLQNKGISEAYKRFGSSVFGKLCGVVADDEALLREQEALDGSGVGGLAEELQW